MAAAACRSANKLASGSGASQAICSAASLCQAHKAADTQAQHLACQAAATGSGTNNSAEAGGDAGAASSQTLLPAMQQLELRRCELDTLGVLLQLAQSTALTSLQLQYLDIADIQGAANRHRLDIGEPSH